MTDLLLDTSAAVPLVMASHAAHEAVRASIGQRTVALAGHALHEMYAVLTRLPGDARVAPGDAVRLMQERFETPVLLDVATAIAAPEVLAEVGIAGGATYDGLVALAARGAGLPLGTRDRRARGTYQLLGVSVEMLG